MKPNPVVSGRRCFDLSNKSYVEQTHAVTFRGVHDENAAVR